MNKIHLIGNVTRDPEVKQTNSGVAICNFSIAVNRRFKNPQTGQTETDFFTVTAFRQLADLCGKYLAKGRKVAVIGSMQSRSYEAQDGSKRTVWDVVADEVEFLSASGEKASEAPQSGKKHPDSDEMKRQMAAVKATFGEVTDEELPF